MPKRRTWIAGATLTLLAACTSPGDQGPPSVVLITLDTTRADRLGAYGSDAGLTPNLDRLADEGALFTQAIAQAPMTLPSHASILTGRYPASHGVRHNGLYRLPAGEVTLAERFAEAGYETAAFIGAFVLNRGFGLEQGFDVYEDVPTGAAPTVVGALNEAQRPAEEVNRAVIEWLEGREDHDRPFFLWVHYYDPHTPYAPPEGGGRRLAGSGYDREVSYMDACLGELLERLPLDRALLAVVGDHGESLGEHGEKTHGVFLYESAVRVPFVVRAPGRARAGHRVDAPVELIDLAPTLLELSGLEGGAEVEGTSRSDELSSAPAVANRVAFAETLMPRIEFGWSELRMVRDARFKFIDAPRRELYDLRRDPGELQNLAANDPERVAEYAAMLSDWRAGEEAEGGDAQRELSAEEEARLRSLGYLAGDAYKTSDLTTKRRDPKDGIREHLEVEAAERSLAAGVPAQALPPLDEVLKANPLNHLARSTRIKALVALKRFGDAEAEALAAVTLAETDPDASAQLLDQALTRVSGLHRMQGDLEAAERFASRAAAVRAGAAETALTGSERARMALDEMLERQPDDARALVGKLQLAMASGDDAEVLATARELAETGVGGAQTQFAAGRILLESGEPADAARAFQTAIDAGGEQADALGYLGTAHLRAGNLAGATEAFRSSSRLRPEDPRPRVFLGNIALLENDEAAARGHYDEARRLDPRGTEPLRNLALWLIDRGRPEEASRLLAEAVESNPDDRQARDLLRKLTR